MSSDADDRPGRRPAMRPSHLIDLSADPPPSTERAEKGETERESTRRRILDAAAAVFREKGFTGTRVVDIARRAGFTPGALYGYFDNRADILSQAIAESSSEMLARLLGPVGVGARPEAVVRAALDHLGEPLGENEQILLDGLALARREPVARRRLADALGDFARRADSPDLDAGVAEVLVILVLGVTAARGLGLHDEIPEALVERLASCVEPPASGRSGGFYLAEDLAIAEE